MQDNEDHVIVVGTGRRPYREYSFQALASRYRLSGLLPAKPDWEHAYLSDWRVVDFADESAVLDGLAALAGRGSGVLTWDETALEMTARAAEKLSLRHMSARSAARCRDKYLTRTLLDEAGLPAVRHGLVHSAEDAERIAGMLGFPVVVKPRALAGSIGVMLASDSRAVRAAFELAAGSEFATLPTGHGVLVEEYLDGPEISVDSVVRDGEVTCVHVGQKELGFEPYFEEIGHLVTGWGEHDEVRDLVVAAHKALGVELGVTHAELRLTAAGPRLVELNGRLGGDFIPYAGLLATGIDLVVAAAELALGRVPDVTPKRDRVAQVRFVYPPHDGVVREVHVAQARTAPGIDRVAVLAEPGSTLLLPPRQAIPRVAALVAAADDPSECGSALDVAAAMVTSDVDALG